MKAEQSCREPATVTMNTRMLMGGSALFMAILGIAATFFPQEILGYLGTPSDGRQVLVVQVAGALYLGFAILNWLARGNLIGGIYSRPLALGNFLHFVVVAITLVRALFAGPRTLDVVVGTVVYSVCALGFGIVLFTHPAPGGAK